MAEIGEVEEREEGVFEWTVRDFMSLPDQVDDFYLSPFFSFGGAGWQLQMYPNGQRNKSDGYIDVYLFRHSSGPSTQLNFSLGLKKTNNEIFEEAHATYNFEKRFCGCGTRFRRSRLLARQSELSPLGHLTIVCLMKNIQFTKTARDSSASESHVKSKIKYFETVAPKGRELRRTPRLKRTKIQDT